MAEDARATILALVELAVGKATPPHEATAAAMAACRRVQAGAFLDDLLPSATSKERGLLVVITSKSAGPGEARAAAMSLCRQIKDEASAKASRRRPYPRRSVVDLDDVGTPEGIYDDAGYEDDRHDVVIVTLSFLILNQSDEVYRVARLEPPKKHSSHVLLIPKRYVRNVVMMTMEESQAIGWGKSSNIIKNLTLVRSYFEEARRCGWNHWQ